MRRQRFIEASHGFDNAVRWKPTNSAATVRRTVAAVVLHRTLLEFCVAHKASGKVNRIDPTSSAEVHKSNKATSAVVRMMIAKRNNFFI